MSELKAAASTAICILIMLTLAKPVDASSIVEFSIVSVRASPALTGSALVLFIPFNSTTTPSEGRVYVISETPVYYHVFSTYPPLVMVFEPSLPLERAYRVYSSVENPYSSYSVSYTSGVFMAYDDFDYNIGMWITSNTSILGGKASVNNGWICLNTSTPDYVASIFSVTGGRGLRIVFQEPGRYVFTLTPENFTDWSFIRDSLDLFFLDERGSPVYYGVVFFSRELGVLILYVEAPSNTVFMIYGGENKYPEYRVFTP